MKITCIETDDFNLLQEEGVYTVEKVIVYEGKLYVNLVEIPHYSFPQRRFKENLEITNENQLRISSQHERNTHLF